MKVTLLNGLYKTQKGHFELSDILDQIKNGFYSEAIVHCRSQRREKGKKAYQQAKLNLPCFTPSGKFGQGFTGKNGEKRPVPPRKSELLDYNGIVVLDYDDLTQDEFIFHTLGEAVKKCPYTRAAFISPSTDGYKVLVQTSNKDPLQHKAAFDAVSAYYKKLTNVEGDKSSSNFNRLCFVSVDYHLVHNPDSLVFEFQPKMFEQVEKEAPPAPSDYVSHSDSDDLTKAMNLIEKNGYRYVEGQRHEYVKRFSIECVKYGVSLGDCVQFVDSNLVSVDCDRKRVLEVVQWAYDNIKEVGVYDTWRKNNPIIGDFSKPKKKAYTPELYKETEEKDFIISIPELSYAEIQELDNDTKKTIQYQQILEKTLNKFFDFRINTLKNQAEYKQTDWNQYVELDKFHYNSIVNALKKNGTKSTVPVLEGIIQSQFSPRVHPLKENFEGWATFLGDDKTDYIKQVADLVKTDAPNNLFEVVFRKWLVASVANVFIENQCTNHHCLILCGGQGTNKTTFLTSLFSSEYVFTGHIDLKNKDSMIMLTDTFLVVLDEQFSVLSKDSEWEALKSAVTMPKVKTRWHYAKTSKLAPRIANFGGTANRIEILQDDTGNRRFYPFQLTEPIDLNGLNKIDLRKMWAQAYKLFKSNWFYLPTAKEKRQIELYQHSFKKLANEHYLLMDMFEPFNEKEHSKFDLELISSTEIWKELDKHYSVGKEVSIAKVGRAMTFLDFIQKTVIRNEDKRRSRYWHIKRLSKNFK